MAVALNPTGLCLCGCGQQVGRALKTNEPRGHKAGEFKGYGVLHGPHRRIVRAHRYSYALHLGSLDNGSLVLHRCDNRRCVNPAHLFLGDHADNMRDKVQKGRHQRGGGTPGAKVTDTEAFLIRLSPADTRSRRLLSALFDIRSATVCGIQNGRAYADSTFGGVA